MELQARFDRFEDLKPCFAFLVNPFIVNVVNDDCSVCQTFVTNLSAVETKLTFSKKNFSQCQFATNFWPQVPENTQNLKEQCTKHIAVTFVLRNEVRKIKPSCKPKTEHSGELIRTALPMYCPGFRGLENQTKT